MQAVNKLSSSVSNKSSWCSIPWWIHSVRWCVQFFSNVRKRRSAVSNLGHLCSARKLLWRKILLRRGQRKVRLSEGWLTLVSFHLFLVWAKSINSELIHPIPKLPKSSEALGSAFSLFEEQEQALWAYCHFHSFLIFQKTLHCTRKQRWRLKVWN